MITTKQKDNILTIVINGDNKETISISKVARQLEVSEHDVTKVIDYLQRKGFISVFDVAHGHFVPFVTLEGDEFYRLGGFEYQDTIASIEVNKLMWELESLQNEIPREKYNKIISSVGLIVNALALFKS